MRRYTIISSILLVAGSACYSDLQWYIEGHTAGTITYGNSYKISISVEDRSDVTDMYASDLLWIQEHIVDTVIPDDIGLKHIKIYIPETQESYYEARDCLSDTFDYPSSSFIVPAARIVVIRPDVWRSGNRIHVAELYIHELIHYVTLRIDGNIDPNHEKSEYWGNQGLESKILDEWTLLTHPTP